MVEFYYWREGSGGKSRLECVVLFLPDVWSAQPSRIEWANVQETYKTACDTALRKLDGDTTAAAEPAAVPVVPAAVPAPTVADADSTAADKSKIVCSQFCLVKFPAVLPRSATTPRPSCYKYPDGLGMLQT